MACSLIILINPHAGSVEDTALLSHQLGEAAKDLDVDVWIMREDINADIRQVLDEAPEYLAANLLPKRLYGERSAETILSELKTYKQVRLHAGVCGERHFLIAAGIGFVSHFARAREHLREYEQRGAVKRLMIETRQGMGSLFAKRLHVSAPDLDRPFKASAAMISPGGLGPAFSGQIEPEARASLECASLGPRHIGELATLGVLAGLDRWRDHQSIQTCWSDVFEVNASRPIEVMLDGEPVRLDGPLHFTVKPHCLNVAIAEA